MQATIENTINKMSNALAKELEVLNDSELHDLFIFFYAGDNLDLPEWDKRSLSGDVKLDEKSRVAILALELGYKIS